MLRKTHSFLIGFLTRLSLLMIKKKSKNRTNTCYGCLKNCFEITDGNLRNCKKFKHLDILNILNRFIIL